MRSISRRLLVLGVLLLTLALVGYFVAQWTMSDPLSFRAIKLVRGWEGENNSYRVLPDPHTLIYEVRNESIFPVVLYGEPFASTVPSGKIGDLQKMFIYPYATLGNSEILLKPGQVFQGKLEGPNLENEEVWLRHTWEPEIRSRTNPFRVRMFNLCIEWNISWFGANTPAFWTNRQDTVAGPSRIPPAESPESP